MHGDLRHTTKLHCHLQFDETMFQSDCVTLGGKQRALPPRGLIPVEKGMKASGLTNSPLSLRKFSGLNSFGNFHCPSSFRTEAKCGIISVP